ncbi:MAG: hypothetical protein GY765_16055 [bacterium]|nr:hypothetical protein [bacterium]
MKTKIFTLALCIMVLSLIIAASADADINTVTMKPPVLKSEIQNLPKTAGTVTADFDLGKTPLYFVANNGQVNRQARFYARTNRYTLWLTKSGLIFDATRKIARDTKKTDAPHPETTPKYRRHASRLNFVNASKNPSVSALQPTELKVNYLMGNDRSKWHGSVPTSAAVLYGNLYENIDMKVYGMEKQIEYDWLVKPGGEPADIGFQYRDVESTNLDAAGNLIIETKTGKMMHKRPIAFQDINGKRMAVEASFTKVGPDTYGFDVGEYDKSRELVIDPLIVAYSTYLGGTRDDNVTAIAVDDAGFVDICGRTFSLDYPAVNQFQTDQTGQDVFVSKLDTKSKGSSSLVYSTYLGGSAADDGYGIALGGSGIAYVVGLTDSTDFPTLNQYQTNQPGTDVFVTKLDTTGSGSSCLIYSTYFGGDATDQGYCIAADGSGNVYIAGRTYSTDFPTLNQYQTDQTDSDAFVARLDTTQSGSSCLIYSTYLGGDGGETGSGIAIDGSGCAYIAGRTDSTDYPTVNQYDTHSGHWDVIVSKIDTTESGASSLPYSTYLGGGSGDYGRGVALGNDGYVYVTGRTYSSSYPTRSNFQSFTGAPDVFITILDTSDTGDDSLVRSSFLGGSGSDEGIAIALDSSNYIYLTGVTESTDYPTVGEFQTMQTVPDAFVTKIGTGFTIAWSTYLGGAGDDSGRAIAVDDNGYTYVTGYTDGTDIPLLNQYQSYPASSLENNFITKFAFASRYFHMHGHDYNGDNTDDIAIYRPSNGRWCVRGNPSIAYGVATDIPVPGDYDGNGSTDIAIYRPSTGRWCVRGNASVAWGATSDIPVPGDYDGDGDTDIAIYRPSNGRWCVMGSASIAWGTVTDIPVPGDYDGNGTTDIAIYRPSTGRWCIRGNPSIAWGTAEDIPVPADYDGDGDTDIAIYRPSTNRWCILGSASEAWGIAGDIPVPGDYDGDGDDDIAIFRPSRGTWSPKGSTSILWGVSTDMPLVTHKDE